MRQDCANIGLRLMKRKHAIIMVLYVCDSTISITKRNGNNVTIGSAVYHIFYEVQIMGKFDIYFFVHSLLEIALIVFVLFNSVIYFHFI